MFNGVYDASSEFILEGERRGISARRVRKSSKSRKNPNEIWISRWTWGVLREWRAASEAICHNTKALPSTFAPSPSTPALYDSKSFRFTHVPPTQSSFWILISFTTFSLLPRSCLPFKLPIFFTSTFTTRSVLLCVQPRQFPAHETSVSQGVNKSVSDKSPKARSRFSVVSLINEQFVSLDRFHSDWTWGRLEIVLSRREKNFSPIFSGLRFNCFHFSNKLRNETWNLSQLAQNSLCRLSEH